MYSFPNGLGRRCVWQELRIHNPRSDPFSPFSPFLLLTEDASYFLPYAYVYDAELNAIVFDTTTLPPIGAVLRLHYEVAE